MASDRPKPPSGEPSSPQRETASGPTVIGALRAARSSFDVVEIDSIERPADPRREGEGRDPSVADPVSATRMKVGPGRTLVSLLEELNTRASGLDGAALETEVSAIVEAVIARHLAALPPARHATAREQLHAVVAGDPIVVALLRDLRSGVARR